MRADNNPKIQNMLDEVYEIEKKIIVKATERAKIENLHKDPKFLDPGYLYHNKLEEFAMFKCSYYMCHKCKDPYFGGLKDCDAA